MSYRLGLTLIMVAAIVAIGCGLYAYFVPLTGVTGVWGPLAAAFEETNGAGRATTEGLDHERQRRAFNA